MGSVTQSTKEADMAAMKKPKQGRIEVTENQLIEAMQAALNAETEGPTGALTTAELAEQTGVSAVVIREELRKLHKAGRLRSTRASRTSIDGRRCTVSVYWILPPGG